MAEFKHQPGSPQAIAEGCTCSPTLNNGGLGTPDFDGRSRFECALDCPIHGLDIARGAIREGRARRIKPPPKH